MAQILSRSLARPRAATTPHADQASDARRSRSPTGTPLFLHRARAESGAPIEFPHASEISAATGVSVSGSHAVYDPSACQQCAAPAVIDTLALHDARTPP